MRVAGAKAGGSGGGQADTMQSPKTMHQAVLMHGPPGICKSSVRIEIEDSGYTMVELNTRDVRNTAGLQEQVAFVPLALAHPLRFFHSLCWHSPEVAVAAALSSPALPRRALACRLYGSDPGRAGRGHWWWANRWPL